MVHDQQHTVTLFSQGWCEFSEMVRLHLESRGQRYTERDIDTDPGARDEMMKLGSTATPVTVIDGEVVIGYDDAAIDERNRVLFAFAAYNAGPGNLRKFRDKAKALGLDPNVWFGNVENGAAATVGRETVQYVSNIYKYYVSYTLIVNQRDQKARARGGS